MALYPAYTSIKYQGASISELSKTLRTGFDGLGTESAKRKWLYLKRKIVLVYPHLSKTDARTLWAFYRARSGSYEKFSWFDHQQNVYVNEYVCVGDGSTTAFNLPCSSISSYTFYKDSVELTETTDYTIDAAGGADGADEINLVVAPASGAQITADFNGYLKVTSRFAEDNLDRDLFFNSKEILQVELRGLLNE